MKSNSHLSQGFLFLIFKSYNQPFFFLTVSFQTISEKTIFLVVCSHGISYPFRLWSDSVLTETSLNAWSLSQWWSWSSKDPLMYFSEHTSCARHAYGSLNSAEYTGTLKFPNFTKNLSPCFSSHVLGGLFYVSNVIFPIR